MTDTQYNRQGSFAKSDDFMDDHAAHAAITAITQIAPLAASLKAKLNEVVVADGIGSQDNRGTTVQKNNLKAMVQEKMMHIVRAATAFYLSTGDTVKQSIVDYTPTDVKSWIPEELYSKAKKLVTDVTPDGASLIGAAAADVADLDSTADQLNDVIQDPKRAIEVSKVYNAKIDPLLNECANIRKQLDIFMQTLISTEPTLYDEWKETLSIDETGANNPPVLELNITVNSGEVQNIDYSAFALVTNSEIKLINNNDATIDYGFGPDAGNFNGDPTTVAEQSQERKTASALGYHSVENNMLNVRNLSPETLSVSLAFYEM